MQKINTIKRLYHGTDCAFDVFDFRYARPFKDFGRGFYLTSSFRQAQKWAQKKGEKNARAYIYSYSVAPVDFKEWNILELLKYDTDWVEFISKSRLEGMETDYDIIYDRMADNQYREISEVLRDYADGKAEPEQVIKKIRLYNDIGDQYCFKNEKALTLLQKRDTIVQHLDDTGKWTQTREWVI